MINQVDGFGSFPSILIIFNMLFFIGSIAGAIYILYTCFNVNRYIKEKRNKE